MNAKNMHVNGDPGLFADIFTFINVTFFINLQTCKIDVQGIF